MVTSVPFHRVALAAGLLTCAMVQASAQPYTCQNGVVLHGGLAFDCSDVHLLSRVTLEEMTAAAGNDSWGWTDTETAREYALMGLDNGTFMVDITEPTDPLLLGKLPTQTGPSVWRDMKVYADHMYVVSEAPGHGMQVFDLRRLRGLQPDPERTFEPDAVFTGGSGPTFYTAHNIAVNEATGRAYVVGARDDQQRVCQAGLYIVDISEPAAPRFAGCFADDGYTHDVHCVIYGGPDGEYQGREVCFASNEDAVTIVDVTDPLLPRPISQTIYPNVGYTHQGWLSEDHRYFFVNDEFDELRFNQQTRTIILDVTDLDSPSYVGSYFHGTTSITHNLFVRDGFLFAANYTTGLRILDIRPFLATGSIDEIETVGHFDTFPPHDNRVMIGAWSNYPFFDSGVVIISDTHHGLFVVQPANGENSTDPAPEPTVAMMEVFPNPFRDALSVSLRLPRNQHVRLDVFDVLGRHVASIFDGPLAGARRHEITFTHSHLPAGLYIVRALGDDFELSQRVSRTD